jgi:predicted dehydrogenase
MAAKTVKVAFIGAGCVNFGGAEGPWDHASRIENMSNVAEHVIGSDKIALTVHVVGIADVDLRRAQAVLDVRKRKDLSNPQVWAKTQLFTDYREMLDAVTPDCVFIGVPPLFHGQATEGRNIELECIKRGVHCFIEKPISVQHPKEMIRDGLVKEMAKAEDSGVIVSVGYMFRYSHGVNKIKEELAKHFKGEENVRIAHISLRYCNAYSKIDRKEWWDQRVSGGPIVEQATHFCDIARYLGGEINMSTLNVMGIGPQHPLGSHNALPNDFRSGLPVNTNVPIEHQIPKLTQALWYYESGAVGTMTHGTMLHGSNYACEIEVWADGFRAVLLDPYHECKLLVRRTETGDVDVEYCFKNDDYYQTEVAAFILGVASKQKNLIQSSFADAMRTYEFTWAIKDKFDHGLSSSACS